jgi:hypothetical protein
VTTPTPDALPLRWATILLSAFVAATVTGLLTFSQTLSWPAALLAALGVAGAAVPVAHQILGSN